MSKPRHSSAAWLTSVMFAGIAACSGSPNANSSSTNATGEGKGAAADSREYSNPAAAGSTGTTPPPTDAGTTATQLTDPQISSVLSTVNAAELEQANLATKKAQTAAVRGLARDISAAALASQERLTNIASGSNLRAALDVGQAENNVAEQLQADSRRSAALLEKTHANRFDAIYLQSQIDLQRQVIVLLDQVVLPNAQNVLLQTEAQQTRGNSVVFLERARTLMEAINLDSDGGVLDTDAGSDEPL